MKTNKKILKSVFGIMLWNASYVYGQTMFTGEINYDNYTPDDITISQSMKDTLGGNMDTSYTIPPQTGGGQTTNSSVLDIVVGEGCSSCSGMPMSYGAIGYHVTRKNNNELYDLGYANYYVDSNYVPLGQYGLCFSSSSIENYDCSGEFATRVYPNGGYYMHANPNGNNWYQVVIGIYKLGGLAPFDAPVNTYYPYSTVGITATPNGKYVYAINEDRSILIYTDKGGQLSLIGTVKVNGNQTVLGQYEMTITPDGNYAYVSNPSGNSLAIYSIGVGGLLTSIGNVDMGKSQPKKVVVSPKGKYAYVLNVDGTINQYGIDSSGQLSFVQTYSIPNDSIHDLAIAPNGEYAFEVDNYGIISCPILTGGKFSGATTGYGKAGATSVVVTSDSKYVYVTNSDNSISMYALEDNGNLNQFYNNGEKITLDHEPLKIVLANDQYGNYAYVIKKNSTTVSMFSIGSDGVLNKVSMPVDTSNITDMVVVPNINFAYMVQNGSHILQFLYR